jgi:probable F420-dependent oxidoreductase
MHFGVAMFITDYSMSPTALAGAVESRGLESLFLPEHSHIPVSRRSPWPGGGDLPKQYYDVMDPFVALGAAAAVTTTLKLGTGICLVIQRDPIQTALEVATLDQISGGRFLFGVGAGWNAEEMADHGTAFESRFELMAERIAAMKVIWTQNEPEFHGQFVDFDKMMTWPKPVQKPHPPILVGGGFPYSARRAIAYGDAWLPLGRGEDMVSLLPQFRQMAAEAGREPDDLPVSIFLPPAEADVLGRMRDAEVERVVLSLPSAGEDEVLPLLDSYAELAAEVG